MSFSVCQETNLEHHHRAYYSHQCRGISCSSLAPCQRDLSSSNVLFPVNANGNICAIILLPKWQILVAMATQRCECLAFVSKIRLSKFSFLLHRHLLLLLRLRFPNNNKVSRRLTVKLRQTHSDRETDSQLAVRLTCSFWARGGWPWVTGRFCVVVAVFLQHWLLLSSIF